MKGGLGAQPQPLHCRANLRRDVPRGQGDPTKQRYLVRLNEYIAQISRVGNNYNQVVKELRIHFSEKKAMALLYKLEECTIDLVKLSREIMELSREMEAKWQQRRDDSMV